MSKKQGQKSCRNLEKSARQAVKYKACRLHRIVTARNHHLKNALQSCGEKFASELKAYYQSIPAGSVGKRRGAHAGEI